jgi:hypothetical protein
MGPTSNIKTARIARKIESWRSESKQINKQTNKQTNRKTIKETTCKQTSSGQERQTLTNKPPLMPHRQRGGIEHLHVSIPLELKSSPSASPTDPGFMLRHLPVLATLALLP